MTLSKDKKIKVLFGLPSLGIGGIEKHVLKQLSFFDRDRFELHLAILFDTRFNLSAFPNLYDQVPQDVSVHTFDFMGGLDIKSWYTLFRTLKQIKPDVVVTSMFSANAVFRCLKPFVGYVSIAREHNTYTDRKIYHHALDFLLSFVSYKIIAVSKGVADYIHKNSWVPRKKIEVIYNSIDIEGIAEFRKKPENNIQTIKTALGFNEADKVILHVGRLKKQKNQKMLIDVFDIFVRRNPGYKLAIVGRGEEEKELLEYVLSKESKENIHFFGHREDVYNFYSCSGMFVLPSFIEGFAIVGIEAMAFGLPVISTRVAGPDEYVKDGYNGYLVETETEAMVKAMETFSVLPIDTQDTMRKNCIATAQQFSIQKNVERYQNLFIEAVHL